MAPPSAPSGQGTSAYELAVGYGERPAAQGNTHFPDRFHTALRDKGKDRVGFSPLSTQFLVIEHAVDGTPADLGVLSRLVDIPVHLVEETLEIGKLESFLCFPPASGGRHHRRDHRHLGHLRLSDESRQIISHNSWMRT